MTSLNPLYEQLAELPSALMMEALYQLEVMDKAVEMQRDARLAAEKRLEAVTLELEAAKQQLAQQQNVRTTLESHLLHSEKMASLGQLVAGLAHEINNPVGFVMCNMGTLTEYTAVFKALLLHYQALEPSLQGLLAQHPEAETQAIREQWQRIHQLGTQEDIPYMLGDVDDLLAESMDGLVRVKDIVQDLKTFARLDDGAEWMSANVNDCIESALNVVGNELKYHHTVIKELQSLPDIACSPSQLNQVFTHLLLNAAHATPKSEAVGQQGIIRITSEATEDYIIVTVSDTGRGIPPEMLNKIFDPFFTTQPVGQGTGLGLSITHSIVAKHGGTIGVDSVVGQGTTLTLCFPIQPSQLQSVGGV